MVSSVYNEIIFNSWVQSDFYFFEPFQKTTYLKMFRKDHYTFWLKHRIFYLELSVLHKLYVFIPPGGPARTLPHAILWTCDPMYHEACLLQVL